MKPALIWLLLCGSLCAELTATFHTTRGDVVAELQYQTAPKAVANFITLAQGTRKWVDPRDGRIRAAPYYDGLKIHRISNNGSFQFAQCGSPKGDGSEGPGYTFKDEFAPGVSHVPYVLSMANAGPNTNGCQFFFTGALPQPSFDGFYTIFGRVQDPASRTVVDAIIANDINTTTVNGISIQRTDPGAVAFNEHAQDLPEVTCPAGSLSVNPAGVVLWQFKDLLNSGDVFQAFRSETLAPNDWTEMSDARRHLGIGTTGLFPVIVNTGLEIATTSKAFYNLSVARHPGSVAPSHLSNRIIYLNFDGDQFYYQFASDSGGGLCTIYPVQGNPFQILFQTNFLESGGHNVNLIVSNFGLTPPLHKLLFKIGCDTATNTQINGRHMIHILDENDEWIPISAGFAAISR